MDTRDAGRKGGFARMRRLTPDRLLEISKAASDASVAQRRLRRQRARALAAALNPDSNLVQFSPKDRERIIYHANEIERIILASQDGLDVPEGAACQTS